MIVLFFHQLTPLHRAARRGCKNVVEYLVRKKGEINDGKEGEINDGDEKQVPVCLIKW